MSPYFITAPQNGLVTRSQKVFTFVSSKYLSISACHHQQQCSFTFSVPKQKAFSGPVPKFSCARHLQRKSLMQFRTWWLAGCHLAGTGRSCCEAQLQCTVVAVTPTTHCFSEEDGDTGEPANGQRLYSVHTCRGPRAVCDETKNLSDFDSKTFSETNFILD